MRATAEQYAIFTWHVLNAQQVLRQREPLNVQCPSGSDRPNVTPKQIALAVRGGTTTVDGVAVTYEVLEPQITYQPGHTYLLVGALCPGGVFTLSYGNSAVVEVKPDRTIAKSVELPWGLGNTFTGLGSIDRVSEYLRSVK